MARNTVAGRKSGAASSRKNRPGGVGSKRFEDRIWNRYRAVIQLGAVLVPKIFAAAGFYVVVARDQQAALALLRKCFPADGDLRNSTPILAGGAR